MDIPGNCRKALQAREDMTSIGFLPTLIEWIAVT